MNIMSMSPTGSDDNWIQIRDGRKYLIKYLSNTCIFFIIYLNKFYIGVDRFFPWLEHSRQRIGFSEKRQDNLYFKYNES